MFMMGDRAEIRGLWPQPAQGWDPLPGGHRRGAGAPCAYRLGVEFGWQRDWVLQRDTWSPGKDPVIISGTPWPRLTPSMASPSLAHG